MVDFGPIRLRRTGKKIRPWNNPNETTKKNILKNVINTWLLDDAKRMKARNVENPPLKTAGPMLVTAATALWSLEPASARNRWVTCAE